MNIMKDPERRVNLPVPSYQSSNTMPHPMLAGNGLRRWSDGRRRNDTSTTRRNQNSQGSRAPQWLANHLRTSLVHFSPWEKCTPVSFSKILLFAFAVPYVIYYTCCVSTLETPYTLASIGRMSWQSEVDSLQRTVRRSCEKNLFGLSCSKGGFKWPTCVEKLFGMLWVLCL